MQTDVNEIMQALSAPFDPNEIKFKPQTVSGNRALAIPFVDARVVMDRLDEVLGVLNWKDEYFEQPGGCVRCRLSIRVDGEWIPKEDVGGESGQPDEGDRRKSAYSDSLKRVAVKFGIGRYLYRSKSQWVDYDPQKKQFVKTPVFHMQPGHALPAKAEAQQPQAQPAKQEKAPAPSGSGVQQKAPSAKKPPHPMPKNKDELVKLDEQAAGTGKWKKGDLKAFLIGRLGENMFHWQEPAFRQSLKDFCAPAPKQEAKKEASAEDDPPLGHYDDMVAWLERLDDACATNGYSKRGRFFAWMKDKLGGELADWDAGDIQNAIDEFKTARTPG